MFGIVPDVADLSTFLNAFPSVVLVVAVITAAAAAAAVLVAERFVLLRSPRTFFFSGTFVRIAACTITYAKCLIHKKGKSSFSII